MVLSKCVRHLYYVYIYVVYLQEQCKLNSFVPLDPGGPRGPDAPFCPKRIDI